MSTVPRVRTALPHDALRAALAAVEAGRRVIVATMLRRKGSAPSTPGQKLALVTHGDAVGTVGGGAVELRVLEAMAAMLDEAGGAPRVERFELGATMGMCCGGSVEILFEPMDAPVVALVVGAGHVGASLAPLLGRLGFRVVVCDAREDALRSLEAGGSHEAGRAEFSALLAEHDDEDVRAAVGSDASSVAALVMTHDHQLDQRAIEWALAQGFGFVGGVGSRAKAARTRQRLEAKGLAPEVGARVSMPIGVDIGARTPLESAVAIAAELVAWRARGPSAGRAAGNAVAGEPEALAATEEPRSRRIPR